MLVDQHLLALVYFCKFFLLLAPTTVKCSWLELILSRVRLDIVSSISRIKEQSDQSNNSRGQAQGSNRLNIKTKAEWFGQVPYLEVKRMYLKELRHG